MFKIRKSVLDTLFLFLSLSLFHHLSLSLSAVLSPLLSSVEAYSSSCSEFESWLEEQEGKLEECGPIGADLNRLKEQTELLKV